MNDRDTAGAVSARPTDHIVRHAAVDRAFHWITAASVLVLMATGLLPVLGVELEWVTIHWVTGVILAAAVGFHLVRSIIWQRPRMLWITARDLRASGSEKYSVAQKLMHHAMALMVLTVVVTGLLMTVRIDTPLWERNPYMLAASTWGYIYVLHGAAALLAVTLVMIHVYFALIPQNRMYLRAMIRGWITAEEDERRRTKAASSHGTGALP